MRANSLQRPQAFGRARFRLVGVVALAALATSLIAAPAAPASKSQSTIFDLGGVAFNVTPEKREDLLNQTQSLGVDTVRIIVFWRDIAPNGYSTTKPAFDATNPDAYPPGNWAALDQLVTGAQARGMDVLLAPSAPVPHWASSAGDDFTNPDPGEFGKFVTALGTRYSGVHMWSVWNEPNIELFLIPQYQGGGSVSGKLYRGLFLAAQQGLQATGHGADRLLIGETSPGPGRKGTHPITFLRGLFCLNRKFKPKGNCAPIQASGWAQHPYNPFDPPWKTSHNLIDIHSIGRLAKALKKARRAGATTRKLPIYVTEFGVESTPDPIGVSQLRQAEYIGISEYLLYRKGVIRSFGQYLMNDDSGGAFVFQTGLRFNSGAPKVSYSAFPITLVAQRTSRHDRTVTIWGHVRPAGGPVGVTVESKDPGGGVKTLRNVTTNAAGYFRFNTRFHPGRRYRASSQLLGNPLQGPFQRSYVFK